VLGGRRHRHGLEVDSENKAALVAGVRGNDAVVNALPYHLAINRRRGCAGVRLPLL
jgi:saccharopine dehydrogenase-like NADP-dependent oxidoreductase